MERPSRLNICSCKIVFLVLFVMMFAVLPAQLLAETSANIICKYSFDGSRYYYNFDVQNTSDTGYDVYDIMLGFQQNVPIDPNPDNQTFVNTLPVHCPDLWNCTVGYAYGGDAFYSTDWRGDSTSSGYIVAGTSLSGFAFSSPTPPPLNVPFSVDFYWSVGWGGIPYLSTTTCTPATAQEIVNEIGAVINDLVNSKFLSAGQGKTLNSQLALALQLFNKGKTKQACNALQDFINQVHSLVKPRGLPAYQGAVLVGLANSVNACK